MKCGEAIAQSEHNMAAKKVGKTVFVMHLYRIQCSLYSVHETTINFIDYNSLSTWKTAITDYGTSFDLWEIAENCIPDQTIQTIKKRYGR